MDMQHAYRKQIHRPKTLYHEITVREIVVDGSIILKCISDK